MAQQNELKDQVVELYNSLIEPLTHWYLSRGCSDEEAVAQAENHISELWSEQAVLTPIKTLAESVEMVRVSFTNELDGKRYQFKNYLELTEAFCKLVATPVKSEREQVEAVANELTKVKLKLDRHAPCNRQSGFLNSLIWDESTRDLSRAAIKAYRGVLPINQNIEADNDIGPWIGVDLDGTLAHYDEWKGHKHIGEPIMPMVNRVKNWLAEGISVKIMTARCSKITLSPDKDKNIPEIIADIQAWCEKHIGQKLPVTNKKDYGMVKLYDDRAIQVIENTGELVVSKNQPTSEVRQKLVVEIIEAQEHTPDTRNGYNIYSVLESCKQFLLQQN